MMYICSPAPKNHGQRSKVNTPSSKVQGSKQGGRDPAGLTINNLLQLHAMDSPTRQNTIIENEWKTVISKTPITLAHHVISFGPQSDHAATHEPAMPQN